MNNDNRKPDAEQGVYRKYNVERLNDPAGKHRRCHYFVLDLVHDKYAVPALEAYAKACADEFPTLAFDLRHEAAATARRLNVPPNAFQSEMAQYKGAVPQIPDAVRSGTEQQRGSATTSAAAPSRDDKRRETVRELAEGIVEGDDNPTAARIVAEAFLSHVGAWSDIEQRIVEMIRYIGVKAGVADTVYGEMCHEARCILRNAHLDYTPSSTGEHSSLREIAEARPPEKNDAAWSLVNTARRALGLPQIIVNPPRGWTP